MRGPRIWCGSDRASRPGSRSGFCGGGVVASWNRAASGMWRVDSGPKCARSGPEVQLEEECLWSLTCVEVSRSGHRAGGPVRPEESAGARLGAQPQGLLYFTVSTCGVGCDLVLFSC